MATIQERNKSFRVLFLHEGRRYAFTIGQVSETQAGAHAEKVDELLALLADGTLSLPEGVGIVTFMRHKGKPPVPAKPASVNGAAGLEEPDEPVKLSAFREKYLDTRSGGSMEENSLATARLHLGHFVRTLGKDPDLRKLTLADLQGHVNKRRKEGDPRRRTPRDRPLSAATMRLEVSTLRSAWNWAVLNGLVNGAFPGKGLQYPKADEQPPYLTVEEIERRVQAGGGPRSCGSACTCRSRRSSSSWPT
jgi:hypothetical protein